ncbi:MAG: zinc-ribbon domain-containing protein [Candidatus Angelobacter sp.]
MAFCAKCGAQLNEGSGFCGACGAPIAGQSVTTSSGAAAAPAQSGAASTGMTNNVAGMLCYILGVITGIIFLVIEPYNKNRFVRFHAFQSIFFWVACFGFWMIWSFVFVSLLFTPGLGMWGLISLVSLVIRLAMFAGWIFVMYKAYNNEEYKLPFIGDLAAKQAGA